MRRSTFIVFLIKKKEIYKYIPRTLNKYGISNVWCTLRYNDVSILFCLFISPLNGATFEKQNKCKMFPIKKLILPLNFVWYLVGKIM